MAHRTTRVLSLALLLLVLGGLLGPQAASAQTPAVRMVFVDARQGPPGVDTGIDVTAGQTLVFAATGRASYGSEGAPDCMGNPQTDPNGQRYLNTRICGPKTDCNAILACRPIGLLIGRIGSGPWFAIGSASTMPAPNSGRLFLLYNELYWADNSGGYNVTIVVTDLPRLVPGVPRNPVPSTPN